MPISRYHIQSAHRLADPELHRAADKDDSEALLEAVAMAELVGLLRQLGDLAQFAAEMFHNLHEEVMATAERGHSLKSRVQQLEADIPALEKAFLRQTHHSSFFTNGGIDWYPNLRFEQNPVTRGDLPRFILDSYEECRGPPRLFLLDKFDVAGAGACLKRYTDPSFFKAVSASSVTATEVHREKRARRVRQKKGAWLRNGETPKPSHSKLHQLFLEEHIENVHSDPARLVKLRKRQLDGSAVDANTGKGYMEKFLEMPSPDNTLVCETSIFPPPVKWMSDDTSKTGIKILDISSTSMRSLENDKTHSSPNEQELKLNSGSEMDRETNGYLVKVHEQISAGETDEMSSNHFKVPGETEMLDDEQEKRECSLYGYRSDDATSEVDNYMDALATMDSELETDNDCRPKKSLLNVQKITGLNGEEQQPQAQFSDSQSFGDSSMSEEIISFEQDQSDEHNEVQAWLPESQSTGTPCASDDDCSLRRDRNEDHTQLQLQFTDSQSIGNSSSEIEHIPSNQLPQTVQLQNTSAEFVTHDDAHDQREMISNSIPVSSGSYLMDPRHLLFPSDLRVTSLEPRPTGTQSDETPSVPVQRHLTLEEDEDRKCLVESIAAESHDASPIKDDSFPVVSFDCSSLSNLDVSGSYVHSNSELRVSNDLNMFHEDDGTNHSDIKVLQESLSEYSSETSAVGDIGSEGEDPVRLSMEGDINSGTELSPDDRNLNSEDDIVKTQHNSEDLFPVVETTIESSFTEELCSDLAHGNPQDLPDLAEVELVYPDQQSNFEEVPRIMPGHEINGSTCSLDSVEDAHCKHPPSPDYMRQDNHVRVNDMFSVKGQSQDQAISAPPCVDTAEKDASILNCRAPDCISSPSRNLSNSHEPLLCSSESHQMEIESDEVEMTKFPINLNAEKRENQQEQFSEIVSSSMSLTKLEEAISCFADTQEEKMEVDEAGARESLTELSAHKVVDQPEIASTDAQLNMNKSIWCAPDSGICNNVQHSSLEEKIQYGSSINDMKVVSECSEPDSQRSESMFVWQNNLQNSEDTFSPPFYNQLDSETHLELFLKSQVGQQDVRFQLRNEENYTPAKFQPQLAQVSNQLEQETIYNAAASEFAADVHPDKPSRGSLLKSPGQKINSSGILSDHLPKETNFKDTPPMPPLPPMQWIMSKVQNTSLVSQREEIDVSRASFQPIQSIKPDCKSEFGLSTSERAALPYQNPFLPAVTVESNKHIRSSGLSAGVSEHPVAIPLQLPPVLNEANGQHNYLILERSQAENPFLTFPVVLSGKLPHGNVNASEGETVLNSSPCPPVMSHEYAVSGADPIFQQQKSAQSSSQLTEDTSLEAKEDGPGESHLVLPAECAVSGDDPISPKEKPPQSPNEFIEETTLEVKTLDQSSINLERKQEDPVVSPESPPSVEIVQPNHSMLSSAGQLALSLDTPVRTSEFDTEMPNGKPKNKLPRPPNPVIDVAAALDKSRLRKASDRVRPQIAPKVDERDSLLEQIRSKSFNLKPAVVTRPSIPGPKTNLRVAAILEKANSIRQALAGSDEDDDTDSWSE